MGSNVRRQLLKPEDFTEENLKAIGCWYLTEYPEPAASSSWWSLFVASWSHSNHRMAQKLLSPPVEKMRTPAKRWQYLADVYLVLPNHSGELARRIENEFIKYFDHSSICKAINVYSEHGMIKLPQEVVCDEMQRVIRETWLPPKTTNRKRRAVPNTGRLPSIPEGASQLKRASVEAQNTGAKGAANREMLSLTPQQLSVGEIQKIGAEYIRDYPRAPSGCLGWCLSIFGTHNNHKVADNLRAYQGGSAQEMWVYLASVYKELPNNRGILAGKIEAVFIESFAASGKKIYLYHDKKGAINPSQQCVYEQMLKEIEECFQPTPAAVVIPS